jgi:hypothetical protein
LPPLEAILHGYDTVRIDIIWDIAAVKGELLLGQLEPRLPPEPGTLPRISREGSSKAYIAHRRRPCI